MRDYKGNIENLIIYSLKKVETISKLEQILFFKKAIIIQWNEYIPVQ